MGSKERIERGTRMKYSPIILENKRIGFLVFIRRIEKCFSAAGCLCP